MELNELSAAIIGAAIEVHRQLGPGLLESAYRKCLAYELRERGFEVVEEKPVDLLYRNLVVQCGFRADLLVNDRIVVELKAKKDMQGFKRTSRFQEFPRSPSSPHSAPPLQHSHSPLTPRVSVPP